MIPFYFFSFYYLIMQYEEIMQRLVNERQDILSYMFCLFIPSISVRYSEAEKRYARERYIPVKKEIWVPRGDIHTGFITDLVNEHIALDEEAIGLTSLVRLNDGTERHLGLIDFCCEKSEEGLDIVRMALNGIDMRFGFIIDSGNSYHFIGTQPYFFERYMDLLRKMRDFESIGEDWPNCQISQGYSDLRVTACPKRGKFHVPRLVEHIEDTQLTFRF